MPDSQLKRRVCILLMDSMGIGASLDAPEYGDQDANTFVHIYQACERSEADIEGLRQGPLTIPNLAKLGLYHAAVASSGERFIDLSNIDEPEALFGYAVEQSRGKDTPSGHWEIAGVPVPFDWGYFPDKTPCFPEELVNRFIKEANLPGVLGNKHASGTHIIEELGEEHISSGKPIIYTSADSVFQIAAHEESFGLERLYELCHIARTLVDEYHIGRVIARPFIGQSGEFIRTGNRRDYATPPHDKTLLDYLTEAKHEVIGIGKISDIYAHQGISQSIKAHGNESIFDATVKAMSTAPDGSLVFANFVDFDSLYGHRRDVAGYAKALEDFDKRLPAFIDSLREDDLLILTADHGCDPSLPGSDHTREHIPVLAYAKSIKPGFIGRRDSFADIGQSIAEYLHIQSLKHGVSFLN